MAIRFSRYWFTVSMISLPTLTIDLIISFQYFVSCWFQFQALEGCEIDSITFPFANDSLKQSMSLVLLFSFTNFIIHSFNVVEHFYHLVASEGDDETEINTDNSVKEWLQNLIFLVGYNVIVFISQVWLLSTTIERKLSYKGVLLVVLTLLGLHSFHYYVKQEWVEPLSMMLLCWAILSNMIHSTFKTYKTFGLNLLTSTIIFIGISSIVICCCLPLVTIIWSRLKRSSFEKSSHFYKDVPFDTI